jgi:hypothetical protein
VKHSVLTDDHVATLAAAARRGIRRDSPSHDFWIARGAPARSRRYWREHVDALIRLGYLRVTASSMIDPGGPGPVACRATKAGVEALQLREVAR